MLTPSADPAPAAVKKPIKSIGAKARYSPDELVALVQRQLDNALGGDGDDLSIERERNLRFYRAQADGELSAPAIPDRSRIVATDVADTVEGMLPPLLRIFASSKDAIQATPKHPNYAAGAKLASAYLRHKFWSQNRGITVLHHWLKDSLLQKVGFVKVYWDDTPHDSERTYEGLTLPQAEQILSHPGTEALEQKTRVEKIAPVEGAEPVDVTLVDLRVKMTHHKGRPVIEPVPPEEMRVHKRARYDRDPLFIAQVQVVTRGELEAEGYDLEGVSSGTTDDLESVQRRSFSQGIGDDDDGEFETYERADCYLRLDQDKDGVQEWRRVLLIGDTLFEDQKVEEHPFVWFCPVPSPHEFFGHCPADFAVEPQRLGTSLLRGLVDNVHLTVNQRTAVIDGQVNLDDLTNSRPGGVVRVKSQGAITPLVQGQLDAGAWNMVEWTEQWRERRTGYVRMSQSINADVLNPTTATQAALASDKGSERVELIARLMAEALAAAMRKLLRCIGRYQDAAEVVELMGQWVEVDPREWSEGYDIEIDVGLGTGGKDKRALALQTVTAMQQPFAASGVLPPQAGIAAARAFCDAVGLGDGTEFFPDPQPPQPPPPSEAVQIEQMRLQADAQKFQAEQVRDRERIVLEHQLKQQQSRDSLSLQASNDERDAQRERARAEMDAQLRQIEQANQKYVADLRAEVDRYRADLDAQVKLAIANKSAEPAAAASSNLEKLMSELVAQMSSPAQIVRDQAGRAVGITRVRPTRPPAPNGVQ